MSALDSADLQNSMREIWASHSDQPGERDAFPPFSEKLSVDKELKLSCDNFKQLIEEFYINKDITPLSQLTATPPFPTHHTLAQFASKAYTDYDKRETDCQYEERLVLPDGWSLLTTASNKSKTNGYFGAAYWHSEHQQVVITHRGTKLTNFGALWTDVVGVLFKHHVSQMYSATTFTHKVVEVLQEVKRIKGVSFHLFFTGHSLGGWLAQVTAFTTEYLKRDGNIFLPSNDEQDCVHPHTVVFDSPGCKEMLLKMTDKLNVRNDGRSIDIEHLDITSYLSAPNRINTCNAHLGTVYRIFTDLSDKGGREKNTALDNTHLGTVDRIFTDLSDMGRRIKRYALHNVATHSMDKIVQAFDPETGQVRKDERGQLKVHVVTDWPISAGLKGGEEYKKFFVWAKYLNTYHPNIQDLSFPHLHYYPIRYQTKLYDGRLNSSRIFSEEEQEFLQCYRWLRQLPEFFKPKELFSVIQDNEAKEDAENMLQNFEIGSGTIRCPDASALQALIPYVKRLLQLFPQITENTKRALSSHEVRNRVYQFETGRYIERINQSPLQFNCDPKSLGEFMESKQQKVLHLRVVKGEEWTALIKVHQVLQKTGCLSEGQYTVLKLKRLLKVHQMMDINTLMQSTVTPHLLLMACEDNQNLDEDTKDVIRTLLGTIKQKPNIKIIFTTQSGGDTFDFLHRIGRKVFEKGFVSRAEQLTWSDLNSNSQKKLLENSVTFQGAKISLNKLMSPESPVAKCLNLGALLHETEHKIADPIPISNGYNEDNYIGRTLRHQTAITQEIFNDKDVRNFHVYLASTEQEFHKLCQQNPQSNVHWLQKDESGRLLWLQSQGSLDTLREYIDTESSHTYTADNVEKLFEQAQHQRVMLISDTAGMGKSTVLTHLSKEMKRNFPTKWVVRIDLNDHTDALEILKSEHIDKEEAIEFVSKKLLKLNPGLELELFKKCCNEKQKVRIIIMLDGFDEISPTYKQTVIGLLQALRQTAVEQLWVTTRPHLRKELEDKLQQLSFTMEPFSEENQVEFLRRFWCLKDWFIEASCEVKEELKTKLELYAKHLIRKITQSISDKDREFTGIPLQCRMLAEAFGKEAQTFCQSTEFVPELPFKLDLIGLYETFLNRKYDIFAEEKCKMQKTNVGAEMVRKQSVETNAGKHQILALNLLFGEKQVALLHNNRKSKSSEDDLIRIGIVQIGNDGTLNFLHRTFAEYYVADYFVKELTKGSNVSQPIQDLLLQKIFLEENYRVVRAFIDELWSRSEPTNEVKQQCGNQINVLGKDGVLTLHTTAREGNAHIVGFLLDSLEETGHRDSLVKLLLAQDNYRLTAWHVAGTEGRLEVLHKMWKWAQKVLTPEDISKNVLLVTDFFGRNPWYLTAVDGELDTLLKLWNCAKEVLTPEELKNKLFLARDESYRTAWHAAAEKGGLEVLHQLWEWAEEVLTQEELKNKLFLNVDIRDNTTWIMAAENGKLDVLHKLWEWAKVLLTPEELKNKLFLAKDEQEGTAWHAAAERGQLQVLHKLWQLAKELLTTEELKDKLFLAKDRWEWTAWHVAAEESQMEVLHKMWEWAEEVLTAEELKNKLFLAKDEEDRTAWHAAAQGGRLEVLHKLWEWAKKILTPEELKNKLLLAKDKLDRTAWNAAAQEGRREVLNKLLEWDKELQHQTS